MQFRLSDLVIQIICCKMRNTFFQGLTRLLLCSYCQARVQRRSDRGECLLQRNFLVYTIKLYAKTIVKKDTRFFGIWGTRGFISPQNHEKHKIRLSKQSNRTQELVHKSPEGTKGQISGNIPSTGLRNAGTGDTTRLRNLGWLRKSLDLQEHLKLSLR